MLATQLDIFGGRKTAGDVVEKITHLLETEEETRDDYKLLVFRYWREFDGLKDFMGYQPSVWSLEQWFVNAATSPETLQNRTMEIQRRQPAGAEDAETAEYTGSGEVDGTRPFRQQEHQR